MELPFKTIAMNLNIAASTAYLHYKRFQNTGEVRPTSQPQRESTKKLSSRDELFVIGLFLANPTVYLYEICEQVREVFGKSVSPPTVCRLLARYGMTRKKVQQIASQRSIHYRAAFLAQMTCYKSRQLVWVDETGCDHREHVRKYGYALRGETPIYHRSLHRGRRISTIAAMAHDGIIATDFHTGSVDGDAFADFVRGSLIPQMQAFDGEAERSIVVMDNCSVHHTEAVADLFREAGIVVIWLPPYSPDLNPIEFVFSYVKSYLRCHDTLLQAIDDPSPVIKAAFESVTKQHCQRWITNSGYIQ